MPLNPEIHSITTYLPSISKPFVDSRSPHFLFISLKTTFHFSKKKALSSSIFVGTMLISPLTKGHALPEDLKFAFSERNYSIPSSQTHMS